MKIYDGRDYWWALVVHDCSLGESISSSGSALVNALVKKRAYVSDYIAWFLNSKDP